MSFLNRQFWQISLLVFLSLCPFSILAAQSEKAVIQYMEKRFGPIVDDKSLPVLSAYLQNVFQMLGEAQERLIGENAVSINKFYIIDSPIMNAYVVSSKDTGVTLTTNRVFITTGLIRNWFIKKLGPVSTHTDDQITSAVMAVLKAKTGLMAHELGHPVDLVAEGKGDLKIRETFTKLASQAIEVRAEIDGTRILKEAGLPQNALLRGVELLFSDDFRMNNVLQDAASTHHQNDFRKTILRLFLMGSRLDSGEFDQGQMPQLSHQDAREILREVSTFKIKRYKFHPPKSLMESFQEARRILRKQLETKYPLKESGAEFNHVIVHIEEEIYGREAKGISLTADEKNAYIDVIAEWLRLSVSHIKIFSDHPANQFDSDSLQLGHGFYRNRLQFYSDIDLVTRLKSVLASIPPLSIELPNDRKVEDPLFHYGMAAEFVNPKTFSRHFSDEIVEKFAQSTESDKRNDVVFKRFIENISSDHFYFLWARSAPKFLSLMYHNPSHWIFRDEYLIPYFPFVVDSPISDPKRPGMIMSMKNIPRQGVRKNRIIARSGNIEAIEYESILKQYIHNFWQARGYFATLEAAFYKHRIDYELIAEILDLDPQTVSTEISRAFVAYTNGDSTYTATLAQQGIPSFAEFVKMSLADQSLLSKARRYNYREIEVRATGLPSSGFDWQSPSTFYQLSGINNSEIQNDQNLTVEARSQFANRLLVSHPSIRQQVYIREFVESAKQMQFTPSDIVRKMSEVHSNVIKKLSIDETYVGQLQEAHFKIVHLLKLDSTTSKRWLGYLFFRDTDGDVTDTFKKYKFYWTSHELPKIHRTALAGLIANDVVIGALDAIFRLKRNPFYLDDKVDLDLVPDGGGTRSYYFLLDENYKQIIAEIDDLENSGKLEFSRLIDISSILQVRKPSKVPHSVSNTSRIVEIRDRLLRVAEKLDLTLDQRFHLFLYITSTGPTTRSDQYFKEQILPYLNSDKKNLRLERLLQTKRINSGLLALDLAKTIFQPKVEIGAEISRNEIADIIEKLNEYVPKSNVEKDNYLEFLALKFNIRDKELRAFIEDQKGRNWRKVNPWMVNVLSLVSGLIRRMSLPKRERFLQVLIRPSDYSYQLPADLFNEMRTQAYQGINAVSHDQHGFAARAANLAALSAKQELDYALRESTPEERIPLIELILTAGHSSLINDGFWPHNVVRAENLLNFSEGSDEELLLQAYLNVIPQDEVPGSIAYLLSQAGLQKGSINAIFELFGTVGIKFGQLSSVFEFFGKKHAEDAAKLKDQAKHMTLDQIYQAMDEADPTLKSKIEIVEFLGSAGVKTVVRVRLIGDTSGKTFVGMFRRPRINERIAMNIELGLKFVDELERLSAKKMSTFIRLIIELFREQLAEETQFLLEGKRTDEARKAFNRLNSDIADDLNGWKFKVPEKVDGLYDGETISFYEEANSGLDRGLRWDDLTNAQKDEVGIAMTRGSLAMLFRYGVFDSDRHKGNWLFDPLTKTIWCIDFGQLQTFERSRLPWNDDDRLTLAEFIMALKNNDVNELIKSGLKMGQDGISDSIDRQALQTDIKIALAERDRLIQESLIAKAAGDIERAEIFLKDGFRVGLVSVMEAFVNQGVRLQRKYILGAMKGLMILFGEKYVSYEKFFELIDLEIKRLLVAKFPASLPAVIRNSRNRDGPGAPIPPAAGIGSVSSTACFSLFGL